MFLYHLPSGWITNKKQLPGFFLILFIQIISTRNNVSQSEYYRFKKKKKSAENVQ